MMTLVGPLTKYIKASSHVQQIVMHGVNKLQSIKAQALGSEQEQSELPNFFARDVKNVLLEINLVYQRLGLIMVFGIHVPVLLPLAVLSTVVNLIAVVDISWHEQIKANNPSDARMNKLTEQLLVQAPSSPLLNFNLCFYAFCTWYVWDNQLEYAWIVYCWPLVGLLALVAIRLRYCAVMNQTFFEFISKRI